MNPTSLLYVLTHNLGAVHNMRKTAFYLGQFQAELHNMSQKVDMNIFVLLQLLNGP